MAPSIVEEAHPTTQCDGVRTRWRCRCPAEWGLALPDMRPKTTTCGGLSMGDFHALAADGVRHADSGMEHRTPTADLARELALLPVLHVERGDPSPCW